jgi:hypothetical protein
MLSLILSDIHSCSCLLCIVTCSPTYRTMLTIITTSCTYQVKNNNNYNNKSFVERQTDTFIQVILFLRKVRYISCNSILSLIFMLVGPFQYISLNMFEDNYSRQWLEPVTVECYKFFKK